MAIYVNDSERTVELELGVTPSGSTVDITVLLDGEAIYSPTAVSFANGVLSFTMPYHLCQSENEFTVHWNFEYEENGELYEYNTTHPVSVVTPILPLREIRKIHPQGTIDEIIRIEAVVRHIIQAFTGQTFGKFIGTKTVSGMQNNVIRLPQRLLELESINGYSPSINYRLEADGYQLRYFSFGVPPVKADFYGLHQHVGGVIHNPYGVNTKLSNNTSNYEITGVWGYEEVPAAVQEAARLLINDYACGDNTYRDRYLTSMTAADWRIQFNSQAFAQTGNVRADQLLSDFVLSSGWAVI